MNRNYWVVAATLMLSLALFGCGKGGDSQASGGSGGSSECDKAFTHLTKIFKSEWNQDIDPRAEEGLKNICVPSSSRLITEAFSAKFVACIMGCEKHSDTVKCFKMNPRE